MTGPGRVAELGHLLAAGDQMLELLGHGALVLAGRVPQEDHLLLEELRVGDRVVERMSRHSRARAGSSPRDFRIATPAVRRPPFAPRAGDAQPGGDRRERGEQRGAGGRERLLEREAGDVGEAHWKISVVQSPPWRRTSWARAGPPARSWRSTKNLRSISMP